VQSIEYSGDQASAPTELSYLIDLTSVQVIQTYGAQLKGNLTLRGDMKFVFRNGVYVDTLDEKVYRYGIIGAP
jgi:hypothetical protein